MKLISSLLTILLLITVISSCASTKSLINRTTASIVRVTSGTDDDLSVCTGFVVKPHLILTAKHCLGPLVMADGQQADLIKADGYFDLATLWVTNLNKNPLPLRWSKPDIGDSLIAIGYGNGWVIPMTLKVSVILPSQAPALRFPVGVIVQGGYVHGMSGGPVIDLAGEVVSIVQQTNQGIGYGVGTQIMRTFLLDSGVEVDN